MKNKTKKPSLYVIAGPNGSGKTTFAREFLPHDVKCMEFVNVDLIAGGISPFAPERAAGSRNSEARDRSGTKKIRDENPGSETKSTLIFCCILGSLRQPSKKGFLKALF